MKSIATIWGNGAKKFTLRYVFKKNNDLWSMVYAYSMSSTHRKPIPCVANDVGTDAFIV